MNNIDEIIRPALKEDIGRGDITTGILFPEPLSVSAKIIAKENGILCGLGIGERVFKIADNKIRVIKTAREGARIKKGQIVCSIKGDARGILSAERTALNFLAKLSGIATLTRSYVDKAVGRGVKIMDTRKTTPGLRALEKYAVRCGGGTNHRMGLYDQILIKDNHINAFKVQGSRLKRKEIIEKVREGIKRDKKGLKGKFPVEIEVQNLREFEEALDTGVDIIMLDNMSIADIGKAAALRRVADAGGGRDRPLLEVSGGVTLENVRDIAKSGVDMISIGALTHSAKALDFSLEIL